MKAAAASAEPATPKVVVLWMDGDFTSVNGLAYNNGNGPLRAYQRDQCDGRLGPMPFFDDAHQAYVWMKQNPGQTAQVTIGVARMFGWKRGEIDGD
jgi:hypothetical protein